MKKLLKLAAILLAAVAVYAPAAAAPIVDQNNPSFGGGFCFTDDGRACGQSFRQDHSNISGAGFLVDPRYRSGGNGAVTISIFSTYGSAPSGLIASGTTSGVNSDSGWVDVFWTPVAVNTLAQYFMVIQSTNAIVAAFADGSYSDGNAVFNGSTTAYSSYDLAFRTYADDNVVRVPEPGSLPLLVIAIAGLGFALRNKSST